MGPTYNCYFQNLFCYSNKYWSEPCYSLEWSIWAVFIFPKSSFSLFQHIIPTQLLPPFTKKKHRSLYDVDLKYVGSYRLRHSRSNRSCEKPSQFHFQPLEPLLSYSIFVLWSRIILLYSQFISLSSAWDDLVIPKIVHLFTFTFFSISVTIRFRPLS